MTKSNLSGNTMLGRLSKAINITHYPQNKGENTCELFHECWKNIGQNSATIDDKSKRNIHHIRI